MENGRIIVSNSMDEIYDFVTLHCQTGVWVDTLRPHV